MLLRSPLAAVCLAGIVSFAAGIGCAPPARAEHPHAALPSSTAAIDYAGLEAGVLADLNRMRGNPERYAAEIRTFEPLFRGKLMRRPGTNVSIETTEGVKAVREAVIAVRSTPPRVTLAASSGLARGAREHARDQGRTGRTGHAGSDDSSPKERVERFGKWDRTLSESIAYGGFRDGRDVVMQLVIDDGVPDRGHRRNLLDPSVRVAGIACGPHPTYGSVCVIELAGGFTDGPASGRRAKRGRS